MQTSWRAVYVQCHMPVKANFGRGSVTVWGGKTWDARMNLVVLHEGINKTYLFIYVVVD